jgi:uncharacterized protein YkwD
MKPTLSILLLFLITSFKTFDAPQIDKEEAKRAFELINKIRMSPKDYSKEFKVSLNNVKPRRALIWNDTLAMVAQQKAMDMATRNYFNHVDPSGYGINYYINKSGYKLNPDWLKNKRANEFESIAAGEETAEVAIKDLIVDKGIPSHGHRTHLLGMDEWNGSLLDIGIGFVRGSEKSKYRTYMSIVIAKHNW